ncbi:hypothetical protein [Bdellovibrio sp. HCB2-146]|uniref:hypothetical protein n=1 Tax=Bdellovibrio sp. HCB2-146 TaxID=3394362 RepID=UPI0039BCB574
MWKQFLAILAATHFLALNSYAFGPAAISPLTPDEVAPAGNEDIPPAISAAIEKIAATPAMVAAAGGGAQLILPEAAQLKAEFATYSASRKQCFADQVTASKICRSETNPNLQTTVMAINGLVGVASVAMNDSCSKFKQAMGLANAAMTAYTVACGALRVKCNMSCSTAIKSLMKILDIAIKLNSAVGSESLRCTPGLNPSICYEAGIQIAKAAQEIMTATKRDMATTDKLTLHGKQKTCEQSYGMLLASAGVGIMGMFKGLKEGKNCDEDTNSSGGSSTSTAPAAGVGTAASTTAGNSPELAGSGSSTGTTSGTTTVATGTPSSYSTSSDGRIPTLVTVDPPTTTPDTPTSGTSDSLSRVKTQSRGTASETPPPGNPELRKFLPGGTHDPAAMAGTEKKEEHPDITGPGGKSNFQKMRIRFRELGLED